MAKNPMDESRRHEMRKGDMKQDKKEKPAKGNPYRMSKAQCRKMMKQGKMC